MFSSNQVQQWQQARMTKVQFDQLPMWEVGGVDFASIMEGLAAVGYEGYVTVHQAFAGVAGPEDAVGKSAEYLRSIGPFD